jgi:hypothetical protein
MNPWGRTHDHPHIRSPKGVMSCDEIRYWLRELTANHGWTFRALARLFGRMRRNGQPNDGAVRSKLNHSWIYPGDQVVYSRQIDRILSGELVRRRSHAVVADHPVPIHRPARMVYDFVSDRLRWVNPRLVASPTLPSFATAFERAEIFKALP